MLIRYKYLPSLALAFSLVCSAAVSHPADENPDLTLPETTREYRQARFGMFIHWGIDTILCDGESVLHDKNIPVSDYERLASFFNPAAFNPAEWVSLAKAAGMHYITFTTKDRDGLAMWDSAVSDWNVVNSTPFARDVVRQLADECRREGIKLFLNYSPLDAHHAHTINSASTSEWTDTFTTASIEYTNAQLTELLTKYEKIDGVRLDGWWDNPEAQAQLPATYNIIRKLQPSALIGNNHHHAPLPGEDFQIADAGTPASEPDADGDVLAYSPVPMEINDTINQSRGYRLTDHEYKSTRELVHSLVRAAGADSNYQLNIGAMPNGQIQPEFADRLRRVGMWLAKHGEAVYATRGGPVAPQPWGVTTHRRHKVYVHVLDPEVTTVTLQLPYKIRTARYLIDENEVPFTVEDEKISLTLRPERRGDLERLLVLETQHY